MNTYTEAQYVTKAHDRVWAQCDDGRQVTTVNNGERPEWADIHAQAAAGAFTIGTFDNPTRAEVRSLFEVA
jgi:hypothetical protein